MQQAAISDKQALLHLISVIFYVGDDRSERTQVS